jgi:hypothetical protein
MSSGVVEESALFVFLCLLVGIVMKQVNKAYKIPYTPMLLIVGILWGVAAEHLGEVGMAAI